MTTTASSTLGMTAHSPEDVLAAVPVVLGFVPTESVVMLTLGAAEPFHARLDLPASARERHQALGSLLRPAVRHGVRRVLFVVYAADAGPVAAAARALARGFALAGIGVVGVLRSDGQRWFAVAEDGSGEGPGTPYDVGGHLFTAQAVAAGRVTRASRAALAETVAADPAAVQEVREASAGLVAGSDDAEVAWARSALASWAQGTGPPEPWSAARLLLAVRQDAVRDALLGEVDRDAAEHHLPAWSALVRVAPDELVAPAAAAVAFLAWLSGDGALAWCALDRAAEGDPPCSLATTVTRALEVALPPSAWTGGPSPAGRHPPVEGI